MSKQQPRRPRNQASRNRSSATGNSTGERLQKVLAAAGHGSRRACEELILSGRVEVDGEPVQKLGTKVDASVQKITVDGERLVEPKLQYFALNKPPGVVSTSRDPSGRPRVIDLIKTNQRVYNVGRLDKSSEGLILVTNDGELANRLTHPSYGVAKKYHVLVAGRPEHKQLAELRSGIHLAEARVRVSNIVIRKRLRDRTWLEIVLEEGRNREIRRILARIGHKVLQLRRVAIGPLVLGDLPLGMHRKLTAREIKSLQKAGPASTAAKPLTKKKPARKPTAKERNSNSGRENAKPGKRSAGQKKSAATRKRGGNSRAGSGRPVGTKKKLATRKKSTGRSTGRQATRNSNSRGKASKAGKKKFGKK